MFLRQAGRRVLKAAATRSRSFASASSFPKQKVQPITKAFIGGSLLLGTAGAASIVATAKDAPVDIDKIKEEIVELFDNDNYIGPTLVRFAWHASGTFCKADNTGGSKGGTIRFHPEIDHAGNAGLDTAVKALEPIKKRHPEISYADLYILAGITMIEEMGGPSIPFRLGRKDAESGEECTPDGRLPDADKGEKKDTIQHVRDVFYRMGFNDREIVALIGAHALGRCYPDRIGYTGPWTRSEWTFSNEFFRELLEDSWKWKKWDGPRQFEDPTGDLMMLPSDMALIWDPVFKKYVEMYAKDEDLWFEDFAKAFKKLTENGVDFPEDSGWKKFMFWKSD